MNDYLRPHASADALPKRIAVFRALQIGDLLVTVPALRALRRAYPRSRITLIGLPWAGSFVQRFGYCDEFMEFPGFPGLPERTPNLAALPTFYELARKQRFDLAIQMHGSGGIVNPIVEQLGARAMAGFKPSAAEGPAHFLVWDEKESELKRYLRLMEHIGVPLQGEHLEFPVMAHERNEARALLNRYLPLSPRPYVCIHAGSRLPSRRWPPERFAAVADALSHQGFTIVLTGAKDELEIGLAVRRAMRNPAVNLIGKTSLGGLAALVRDARLVVCNDTSMSHVAAAMRTPSVVISSGADVERWKPLDEARHPVLWHDTPCRPCAHAVCPYEHHACSLGVGTEAVVDTACRLLSWDESRAA